MSDYISNFCSRQKATILVEKSSTRPTVFCEVWRLFLLYCRNTEWSSLPDHDASSLETFKYRPTSSKPIFSYNRITDKLCGSPAWKHTFIRGYTSSVGVQHGNNHSHKRIFQLCGSPALTQ